MIKVYYSSNPTALKNENHKGDERLLVSIDSKEFNTQEDALAFYDECTEPLTTLSEIYSVNTVKEMYQENIVR